MSGGQNSVSQMILELGDNALLIEDIHDSWCCLSGMEKVALQFVQIFFPTYNLFLSIYMSNRKLRYIGRDLIFCEFGNLQKKTGCKTKERRLPFPYQKDSDFITTTQG